MLASLIWHERTHDTSFHKCTSIMDSAENTTQLSERCLSAAEEEPVTSRSVSSSYSPRPLIVDDHESQKLINHDPVALAIKSQPTLIAIVKCLP